MTDDSKRIVTIGTVVFILASGCAMYPSGPEVDVSYYGSVDVTGGTFTMNGYLLSEGGIANTDQYRNVTLYLYTEDSRSLAAIRLGHLRGEAGRLNVSVSRTFSNPPHHVVFSSPDFWTEDVSVDYFARVEGEYTLREAGSKSELPIRPRREAILRLEID